MVKRITQSLFGIVKFCRRRPIRRLAQAVAETPKLLIETLAS